LSTNLATYPIIGKSVKLPGLARDLANFWFLLILAKVGSLCALALFTHAEVQAAVDLFEELRQARYIQDGQQLKTPTPVGTLVVPLLQLMVATATLFVQGIMYQSYTVPAAADSYKFTFAMEAVYSCVGLVFILDLDNQAWKLVQPLLTNGNHDSPHLLTAVGQPMEAAWTWMIACCKEICRQCRRCMPCSSLAACCCCNSYCSCCSWECVLVYAFHIILFVYECTFGMLLTLYATDHALILSVDNPGQLAAAIVLSFFCFLAMQTVA
jgi:hypothetical protein